MRDSACAEAVSFCAVQTARPRTLSRGRKGTRWTEVRTVAVMQDKISFRTGGDADHIWRRAAILGCTSEDDAMRWTETARRPGPSFECGITTESQPTRLLDLSLCVAVLHVGGRVRLVHSRSPAFVEASLATTAARECYDTNSRARLQYCSIQRRVPTGIKSLHPGAGAFGQSESTDALALSAVGSCRLRTRHTSVLQSLSQIGD